MQIANVKQRQIWFPRVGNQIWVSTPQNLASDGDGFIVVEVKLLHR